ncbi:hypothetical protein [Bradyrhizobium sp. AUGA SZCCT0042]|uniref:hypothetical protein n=1 Tax=Bradyrhizobium sp. AUGA SZCCT0042 TaxID=2807651 RepID=UPI001BA74A3C|nr:hypothetical protein [Bradyrhizobium sp. AUGA SZCCT0042]MBR1302476.1 hypothetical protein [Bradyrhizobium sp. AUGA SZCCT0042]
MKRRRWSEDDIARLRGMAKNFPAAHIASELGRGISAVAVKAHELQISLRMKPKEAFSGSE